MKEFVSTVVFSIYLAFACNAQDINQVFAYYANGQFEEAYKLSSELIQQEPNNPVNIQIHGRILSDLEKHHEAISLLEKAVEIDEGKTHISGWAYAYMGQSYFMLGKYELSEKSLEACIKLNATTNSVNFAKKRFFSYGFDTYFSGWKIVETGNLRFHIQNPENYENIDYFMNKRQKAFVEISQKLGSSVPKKVDFFVWENATEPFEKFKIRLGFADPKNVCVYSHKNQTIGHEITHVISNYIAPNPQKTALINEGLAIYFNMENNNKCEDLLKVIKTKNLKELKVNDFWADWNKFADDISYPFAGAFMENLIEKYGIEKLKPLFVNQTYEKAVELFGDDFKTFITKFEQKINQK